MKRSVEHLHHFNCRHCEKWWSIGDAPQDRASWWCPWCGVPQKEGGDQSKANEPGAASIAAEIERLDRTAAGSLTLVELSEKYAASDIAKMREAATGWYVVELQEGVYLADGEGDPPRTLVAGSALRFASFNEAVINMERAVTLFPREDWKDRCVRKLSEFAKPGGAS